MSSELFSAAVGLGGIGAAIWLWRAAKIAIIFKILSMTALLVAGLSALGVMSIELHPERVVELARLVWGAVGSIV